MTRTIVIIGGTSGIGLEVAKDAIARGEHVVDLSEPDSIAGRLAEVGPIMDWYSQRLSETRTRFVTTTSRAQCV